MRSVSLSKCKFLTITEQSRRARRRDGLFFPKIQACSGSCLTSGSSSSQLPLRGGVCRQWGLGVKWHPELTSRALWPIAVASVQAQIARKETDPYPTDNRGQGLTCWRSGIFHWINKGPYRRDTSYERKWAHNHRIKAARRSIGLVWSP